MPKKSIIVKSPALDIDYRFRVDCSTIVCSSTIIRYVQSLENIKPHYYLLDFCFTAKHQHVYYYRFKEASNDFQ